MRAGRQPPLHPVPDEAQRLQALASYHVLDTPAEEDYDRLVRLAARIFDVPIALMFLLGQGRLFFKARVGTAMVEPACDAAFCRGVAAGGDVRVVTDVLADAAPDASALAVVEPAMRFYAGAPLIDGDGHVLGALCIIDRRPHACFSEADRQTLRDLAALAMERLELRRLEVARQSGAERFRKIAETSPDAIVCMDALGRITFWNEAAEDIFGYGAGRALGEDFGFLLPPSMRRRCRAGLARIAARAPRAPRGHVLPAHRTDLQGRRAGGELFPLEISLSVWHEDGAPAFGVIARDAGKRRRSEQRLFRLAHLDSLTELPNRETFRADLDRMVAAGRPLSLLLFDLDGLRELRGRYGHAAGGAVLREVARRLSAAFEQATVARLGGDEFVVLLPDVVDANAITALGRAAMDDIGRPIAIDGGRMAAVAARLGVALYPMHGETAAEVLGSADLALYEAKRSGRNVHRFFVPDLRNAVLERKKLEAELRVACREGQLELFYQPQVELPGRRVVGAEALLRWHHPVRGLLGAKDFIKVLEASETAAEVGRWILESACRQAVRWRQAGVPQFRVAVNLFGAHLLSPALVDMVESALRDSGLSYDGLELEITENTLLHEDERLVASLRRLRDLGVGLAFDDYGTGYASLSLLKRLPITRLKIDRSFISNVASDPEDAAVVRAILYLGRSFHLAVLAEGVETPAQEAFLCAHGCAGAQGYLYGRAVPAAEFPLGSRQPPGAA